MRACCRLNWRGAPRGGAGTHTVFLGRPHRSSKGLSRRFIFLFCVTSRVGGTTWTALASLCSRLLTRGIPRLYPQGQGACGVLILAPSGRVDVNEWPLVDTIILCVSFHAAKPLSSWYLFHMVSWEHNEWRCAFPDSVSFITIKEWLKSEYNSSRAKTPDLQLLVSFFF